MPEDPYAPAMATDETQEPMDRDSGEEQSKDGETALLPKSIFGDKDIEKGSKCSFEVVHVYEDEVEVKYVKEKKPEMTPMLGLEIGLDNLAKPSESYG